METRLKIENTINNAYQTLSGVDEVIEKTSLSPLYRELINMQASQINGCVYRVTIHTAAAKKLGETNKKLALITVWREAGLVFSRKNNYF